MAGLPYMKFYPGDYFLDTGHLTCVQHGIYLQLILRYFNRGGPLPDDDDHLAGLVRLGPREWKRHRETIAAFFQVAGGFWSHRRIDAELAEAEAKVLKSQKAGQASARHRLSRRTTDDQRDANHAESDKESPSSIDIELGRARERSGNGLGKKATKPSPQYEFEGEETIMATVRRELDGCLNGTYALGFCHPDRPINFVREEGRLVAYGPSGFAVSLIRDHEYQLAAIAKRHGFTDAWIKEKPP